MKTTQNCKFIEVENDLFELLCESKFNEKVKGIQDNYIALCGNITKHIKEWMKIKGKDYYFNSSAKILFPDTRKMHMTDLSICARDSYRDTVDYLNSQTDEYKEKYQKDADAKGLISPSAFENKIDGFDADPFTSDYLKIFDNSCPFLNSNGYIEVMNNNIAQYIIVDDSSKQGTPINTFKSSYFYPCRSGRYAALKISIHEFDQNNSPENIIIGKKLICESFDESLTEQINNFSEIVESGIDVNDFDQLSRYLKDNAVEAVGKVDLRTDAIENDLEHEEIDLSSEDAVAVALREYLDKCDYIRTRIQPYNSGWYLSDEGKGHWELWRNTEDVSAKKKSSKKKDEDEVETEKVKKHVLKLKEGVTARNPVADVKHNAVVGIDFGTKSTIVAMQDGDEQIIPLRVGMADYSKAPSADDYENPTVMQFNDLMHFIEMYDLRSGRPMTSWDDLCISHEAFKNMINAEDSIKLLSFVTDLKQWAGGKEKNKNGGHLIIKDSQGYRYDIDDYMKLTDEDKDPIEIYAYYLGLFINNMHTGIYLDYILSFPESFSKEIKDHILKSFEKGIKKSIPPVVFEDTECKEEFRVRRGPGEPAAYAACALDRYGIEPTDKGVFYGIFDFGGGTTDFDYGIWKNAPEDEYTYNYVIRHYGAGGDRTLGGENILELLSYYVFTDDHSTNDESKTNLEIMRENKLVFYRPDEADIVAGTESLINDSESALLNTKLMMETLRPIWEEWDEVTGWCEGNTTEINGIQKNASITFKDDRTVSAKLKLFSESGSRDITLMIDLQMVNRRINDRIDSGVRNFFDGMFQAYSKFEDHDSGKINIFLAGNSSKSKRVIKLFKNYVIEYNEKIFNVKLPDVDETPETGADCDNNDITGVCNETVNQKINEFDSINSLENSHFIIYPPLGTSEAAKIIEEDYREDCIENRIEDSTEDVADGCAEDCYEDCDEGLLAPTGKTGVAFGLVMCHEGSMIKVESETGKNDQIKLNYYIGLNYRKNFKLIFDRNSEYQKWLKFSKIAAETGTFEFYYSELPEIVKGETAIKDNKQIYKRKCLVDNVSEDANIYFRFIDPSNLEYVVSNDEKIVKNEFISKVYCVSL